MFDFQRTPLFFDRWNKDFDLNDMNGGKNFSLIFSSYCPTNITECLNGGSLNSEVTKTATIPVGLNWDTESLVISISDDVTWNIGDNVIPLKAVFLTSSNGFVMGYSININSFDVTNIVKLEKDTILWSIQDGKSI